MDLTLASSYDVILANTILRLISIVVPEFFTITFVISHPASSSEVMFTNQPFEAMHITTQKNTIHQLTTMLSTFKNVLFPGHNHLLTTGADDPSL